MADWIWFTREGDVFTGICLGVELGIAGEAWINVVDTQNWGGIYVLVAAIATAFALMIYLVNVYMGEAGGLVPPTHGSTVGVIGYSRDPPGHQP